jgi:hypothetical protein
MTTAFASEVTAPPHGPAIKRYEEVPLIPEISDTNAERLDAALQHSGEWQMVGDRYERREPSRTALHDWLQSRAAHYAATAELRRDQKEVQSAARARAREQSAIARRDRLVNLGNGIKQAIQDRRGRRIEKLHNKQVTTAVARTAMSRTVDQAAIVRGLPLY